ncbi:MAG: hypothetical protein K9M99_03030 [Candidatus Cloacimonetes bacterium]|nr:hypothetical protein [Candidatus Cloacimonadota bacterium]
MPETGGSHKFLEHNCDIHGRLGDTVYRRKRNGVKYTYPYSFQAKYEPTVLSRRSDCIIRKAAEFTNPQYEGFKSIIRKMYYYTPFFIYPGEYEFRCNTFYMIRQKGNYGISIDGGVVQRQKLAPRTMAGYSLMEEGVHWLRCYNGTTLYSERQVIVIPEDISLEEAYDDWYDLHLAELLSQPDPAFATLPIYRRYLKSESIYLDFSGKVEDFVIYPSCKLKYMYSHKIGSYENNHQTQYFCAVMPRVLACWQEVSPQFTEVWQEYYARWFPSNYRKRKCCKAIGRHHLWSKAVFKAAQLLGFDLKTLSQENWLPGITTLGDLLDRAGFGSYGLSQVERGVKIF